MKARTVTKPPGRRYESPLRERQSADTGEAILRALCEQLAAGGLADFSIPEVARRAGVTTRTVYRHFPSREALLEALDGFLDREMGDLPRPATVTAFVEQVPAQFAAFEASAEICKALLERGPGGAVRQHGRKRRARQLTAAIQAELPRLELDEVRRAGAAMHVACGLNAWQGLREVWGLSPEDAAAAAAWATRLMLADLRRRDRSRAR
jgi:AcrR family transcriptional regulator